MVGSFIFNFLRNCSSTVFQTVFLRLHKCVSPPTADESSLFSTSLSIVVLACPVENSSFNGCEIVSCGFDLHLRDGEHIFTYPLAICVSLGKKCLSGSPAPFLIGLFCFLHY